MNTIRVNYWHDEMSEEIARRVLGSHFDYAVEMGAAFCACHAAGCWQANTPESFSAYKTAERLAKHSASQAAQ